MNNFNKEIFLGASAQNVYPTYITPDNNLKE